MTLKLGELFSGYGGLGLGVMEAMGAELAWHCEFDPAPSKIMAHHYPHLTNYGDVTAVDWATVPHVDIISGGSPCQDLSLAGARKGMTDGTRSNLWESMREAIAVIAPTYVVWENVRGALSAKATSASDMEPGTGLLGDGSDGHLRALGRVLGDLADLGYDCQWRGLRAADVGAPHGRFRVFVLAKRRDATANPGGLGGNEAIERDGRCPTCGNRPSVPDEPDREPVRVGSKRGAAIQDANLATGDQWRQSAPGQAEGRRSRADTGGRGGAPTADASLSESGERHGSPLQWGREDDAEQVGLGGGGPTVSDAEAAADTDGRGCEVSPELDSDTAQDTANGNPRWGHTDGHRLEDDGPAPIDWGIYAPAIRRWEAVRGAAPSPTELTPKGKHRLSARFAEWLMGVPDGWITDVPGVSRNDQLKAAGNGVVPAQCAAALRDMLAAFESQEMAA